MSDSIGKVQRHKRRRFGTRSAVLIPSLQISRFEFSSEASLFQESITPSRPSINNILFVISSLRLSLTHQPPCSPHPQPPLTVPQQDTSPQTSPPTLSMPPSPHSPIPPTYQEVLANPSSTFLHQSSRTPIPCSHPCRRNSDTAHQGHKSCGRMRRRRPGPVRRGRRACCSARCRGAGWAV